jgi:glycosyltransferase involved in cell wall biosynthesis
MKIGFLVNGIALNGSICIYELCQRGISAGQDMRMYGKGFKGSWDGVPTIEFSNSVIHTAEWWKTQSLDAAFIYGLDRFDPAILKLARESGARLIVECDSDGYVSTRQDPLRVIQVGMWDSSYTLRHKAQIIKAWLHKLIFESGKQEELILRTAELADNIKIESEEPARLLREFFKRKNRPDLAEKVVIVYYAVRDAFSTAPVNREREELVMAAGRVGAQQKNPALLQAALSRFLETSGSAQVEIHVRGEAPSLETWAASQPRVRLLTDTPSQALRERLAHTRVLVSTSRYESTPVQGLEALCQGCTLVASDDLPGYRSLIQNGAYGQTYKRDSADDCAKAIQRELDRWESGARDSQAIADRWRSQCSLDAIISRVISLAEGSLKP